MARVHVKTVCTTCGADDKFVATSGANNEMVDCSCGMTAQYPSTRYELVDEDENNTSQQLEDVDLAVPPVYNVINIGNTSLNGVDDVSDERLLEILLKRQQRKE